MPTTLISPMNDVVVGDAVAAPRLASLQGKTVALLDITKPGGSFFLDRLESVLKKRFGVASVIRENKPTYTKPAPAAVLERLRDVDAVIEALAD
jgi:hypothetical protein